MDLQKMEIIISTERKSKVRSTIIPGLKYPIRDESQPIRGLYPDHVITLDQSDHDPGS